MPSFGRFALRRCLFVTTLVVSLCCSAGVGRANVNPFGQKMFGISAGGALLSDSATTRTHDLSVMQSAGAKWIRIDINWASIQAAGPSSYAWTGTDSLVKGAQADGMNVLGVIIATPSWDRPSGTSSSYAPSASSYATFAAAAVRHYAAMGVQAYEVWNEPNITSEWQPTPNPAAYTALLKAAYTSIKNADPGATVLTGGTAPAPSNGTSYSPVDFLSAIYAHGGKGYFDAVSHHPYCWPAYPGDAYTWSSWYQMYGTSPSLRSVMTANGDGNKKIWGTEFGAPTNGPSGHYVSASAQAAMIKQGFQLFSTYTWAGPLFVYQGRDQGGTTSNSFNYMGLVDYSFNPKPSFSAYQQATNLY